MTRLDQRPTRQIRSTGMTYLTEELGSSLFRGMGMEGRTCTVFLIRWEGPGYSEEYRSVRKRELINVDFPKPDSPVEVEYKYKTVRKMQKMRFQFSESETVKATSPPPLPECKVGDANSKPHQIKQSNVTLWSLELVQEPGLYIRVSKS